MNRRTFIKGAALAAAAIGTGVVIAKEQPAYTFIRIITPGHINGHHLWIVRPNDILNPIVPTHRNNLPFQPPTHRRSILSNNAYGHLKPGDYIRFHKDIYSEWQKVTKVRYCGDWRGDWHCIEAEYVFPYNPNEPHHKSLYDSLNDPKPDHQPK